MKVREEKKKSKKENEGEKSRGMMLLPYVNGLSEKVTRILRKRGVATAMKPHTTIKTLLVHPKDKADLKEGATPLVVAIVRNSMLERLRRS